MHRGTINAAEQSLNFNNLNEGWYIFFDEGNVATNKPLDVASFGVVLNQDLGSSKIQICYVATYTNSPRRYYLASRIYSIESGNWNTWRRTQLDTTDFPSFYKNYGSINALATAVLGKGLLEETAVTDLDNMTGTYKGITCYFVATSSNIAHLPSQISSSTRFFLEVINTNGGDNAYDIIQRVTNRGDNITYQRYRTGTTWGDWAVM